MQSAAILLSATISSFTCTASFQHGHASVTSRDAVAVSSSPVCDLEAYSLEQGVRVMKRANLAGCDLTGALLAGADLRGAHLTEARLDAVDLTSASLSRARLRGASIRGASLAGASLRGADLSGALVYSSI